MQVTCPHCSTRYVLLESMLGPLGARVRCPRCREPFMVSRGGIVTTASSIAGENGTVQTPDEPAVATSEPSEAPAVAAGVSLGAAEEASEPGLTGSESLESPAPSEPNPSPARETEAHRGFWASMRPARESRVAAVPVLPPAESAEEIARAVLGELAAHSGEAIAAAQAQGRLFAEFGAVIAEAFEFYQRRLGTSASPTPFRIALREQWGVDLEPPTMSPPRV